MTINSKHVEIKTSHIFETPSGFKDAWNELVASGAKAKDISFERLYTSGNNQSWGPYTARNLNTRAKMLEFIKDHERAGKMVMMFRLVATIESPTK